MVDRIGQQLGNYRLIRLLGNGGFAEVYLGEHIHLNTYAAIKLLHTQLASNELENFRNEARTIARLEHAHIVRVLEFGVEASTPFLVMSYAPNGNLRQRHPRGTPIPIATIIPYVKQIADALQFAHNERLIHRDVKPENMLSDRHNNMLLSDFGIALISPFQGGFTEVASQHLFVPPPPLRSKFPEISPHVEEVVLRVLAKEPQQRFVNILAFANALEQASIAPPFFISPTKVASSLPAWSSPPTAVQSHQPLPRATNQYPQYSPLTSPSDTLAPSTPREWLPWIALAILLLLVISLTTTYFSLRANANGNTQSNISTQRTKTVQVTPSPQITNTALLTATSVSHTNVVGISDEAQVLNTSLVQSEAAKLPYPINIYTTNTFNGSTSAFDQQTRSHVTSQNLLVMAIDTVHKHLAIVGGSGVLLSTSQYNDATQAFVSAYSGNNGDYTVSTIAALRSLEKSLGIASTEQIT